MTYGKTAALVFFLMVSGLLRAAWVEPGDLLQDPSADDWISLERYSGILTREEFELRRRNVFDPFDGLAPFLRVTDGDVTIYPDPGRLGTALARISFATPGADLSVSDSAVRQLRALFQDDYLSKPLAGLRVAIEPANIGGRWAAAEDRSTYYRGYGRIQEGDVNLTVARILRYRLWQLGADVFVTRLSDDPVGGFALDQVSDVASAVLAERPYILPAAFQSRARNIQKTSPFYLKVASEVLLTKNLETRARAEKTRRLFRPDITIVLQFNATPASSRAALTSRNRNIFFISGAYTANELARDPRQRLRLLGKLFQNVTPTEKLAAVSIANQFRRTTSYPPVLYGNGPITRSIPESPYVVARNLAFNREHDGPVVVTEPYFMNEPVTLQRLLAGDYLGAMIISGWPMVSIYQEYAEAVAAGLVDAFGHP